MNPRLAVPLALLAVSTAARASEKPLSPDEWGAPPVTVSRSDETWTLSGEKQRVTLDAETLALTVETAATVWTMPPSPAPELVVVQDGDEFGLHLTDAREMQIDSYETGYSSGVKITLDGYRSSGIRAPGAPVGIRLYLTLALEGGDEDLCFEVSAVERDDATIRQLDWPPAVDGREVDMTVLSHDDGMLLPRDWPRPYYAIHRARNDTSVIQSNLIESWSMSWWGFLRGDAGLIVIVETPDDAAYTFSHPAGGPTSIGPAWRAQLGRFEYLRSLRMAFLDEADHVALAKRYRRHVVESGLFVSLREKIARTPLVQNLIGNPFARAHVLRNVAPGGARYDTENPENNYRLTTFAEHVEHLREWKALGLERLNVTLAGWPHLGYDRQHPDGLPPTEAGGGWDGMKAFFDACRELGYTCWLHDQYRDYYPDAPSWDPQFAVHEQDSVRRTDTFPGTRFSPHNFKEGYIPFLNYWDGGKQAYLNNRYMLGHIRKNYRLVFEHGIRPQGSYNDVFGYVPPDQDFNAEHPTTRTESMRYRAAVLNWTRANLGIVGTEDGADWTIPYVDYTESRFNRNPGSGNDATSEGAIVAPLYDLVYHDAVVTSDSADNPRTLLFAHAPRIGRDLSEDQLASVRRAAALHRRVGLLEMTRHEFLDSERRRERTTFADGTTVTVDWDTEKVEINPPLQTSERGVVPLTLTELRFGLGKRRAEAVIRNDGDQPVVAWEMDITQSYPDGTCQTSGLSQDAYEDNADVAPERGHRVIRPGASHTVPINLHVRDDGTPSNVTVRPIATLLQDNTVVGSRLFRFACGLLGSRQREARAFAAALQVLEDARVAHPDAADALQAAIAGLTPPVIRRVGTTNLKFALLVARRRVERGLEDATTALASVAEDMHGHAVAAENAAASVKPLVRDLWTSERWSCPAYRADEVAVISPAGDPENSTAVSGPRDPEP